MNARLFIAFLAIASCGTPGLAHAFLQHADPGAGTTLRAPPQRVALSFNEKLEPVFSGVSVTDASGRNVEAGAAVIAGSSIVVPIRSLMPGSYRVSWHAVSVDTHRTEGAYSFMVKP
jgi:methionine-rich copper-binding protein CopC